jgi:hypothetical protein
VCYDMEGQCHPGRSRLLLISCSRCATQAAGARVTGQVLFSHLYAAAVPFLEILACMLPGLTSTPCIVPHRLTCSAYGMLH